jgi:hypothetical protein
MPSKSTLIYYLARPGYRDYYEVHVSKTMKIMHNHIKKLCQDVGAPVNPDLPNIEAMVKPMFRWVRTERRDSGLYCYLFLNEENLDERTIAHECLHVAMCHERCVNEFRMAYSDDMFDTDDEERLAYFLGDVVRAVYMVLRKGKHLR